ncbi:hypothetical protein [Parolsenella catena]|uniref:hypothetical protein n=1 Tax=Parolsenella catena TaxID=2003188 RepID=UPI003A8D63EA
MTNRRSFHMVPDELAGLTPEFVDALSTVAIMGLAALAAWVILTLDRIEREARRAGR